MKLAVDNEATNCEQGYSYALTQLFNEAAKPDEAKGKAYGTFRLRIDFSDLGQLGNALPKALEELRASSASKHVKTMQVRSQQKNFMHRSKPIKLEKPVLNQVSRR